MKTTSFPALRRAAALFTLMQACGCSSSDDGGSSSSGGTATSSGGATTATSPTSTPSSTPSTATSTTGVAATTGGVDTTGTTTSTDGATSTSSTTTSAGTMGAGGTSASTTADSTSSTTSAGGDTGTTTDQGSTTGGEELELFSFFVASWEGMQRLSGSENGFGGDLRYGEADGLTGADKICTELAEESMPGSGAKVWRAFLSTSSVNAIDRVGEGPWYDRLGRVVAMTPDDLLNTRPNGADSAIIDDLPNEYGVPNHQPDPNQGEVDNHHVLTGSDENGQLYGGTSTCDDWTTTDSNAGRPRVGFSWPAGNRQHWISGQDEGGCGAGAVLIDMGGSDPNNPIVGSGGGYGAIYCLALTP